MTTATHIVSSGSMSASKTNRVSVDIGIDGKTPVGIVSLVDAYKYLSIVACGAEIIDNTLYVDFYNGPGGSRSLTVTVTVAYIDS